MRRAAAILLAFAALAALPAAKPVPPAAGPGDEAADARDRSRGQGISLCVAELRAIPDLSPDDLENICGCAVDRVLDRPGPSQPDQPQRGPFPAAMRGPLISCTAQRRPERAGDVARLTMAVAPASPPVAEPQDPEASVTDSKPAGGNGGIAEPESGSESAGGGFRDWLGDLGLPAWLTGVPLLWWIAGGIFLFGLLIMKIRGHDPRRDLSAPPSHMRRGASPQPPPRRPDLPR